ncbi:hypothetical protein AVEN_34463-1 [Araneus ventricosus]|uniref:Uncharacterized protein n=1 Tax=Araneus ventricosus TaxID=182803 RepID=A0A4Y2IIV5_ARAVE|nr:hypothetical protein AVEN_34463-1 [Araneus ventricosus]
MTTEIGDNGYNMKVLENRRIMDLSLLGTESWTTASGNANTLRSLIVPTPHPPSKRETLPTCFDFPILERAFCPQIYLYRSHFLLYGPEFQRDIQLSASIKTGLSHCRPVLAWSGGECPASQMHSFNLMGIRKRLEAAFAEWESVGFGAGLFQVRNPIPLKNRCGLGLLQVKSYVVGQTFPRWCAAQHLFSLSLHKGV